MENNTNKKIIFALIVIGIIWLAWVLYRMFTDNNNVSDIIEEEILTTTNNLLDTTSTLPIQCQKTMEVFNCLLSSPELSGESEGINQYYQQLIGQRNTITDDNALLSECTAQYKYITSLQATWYQDIIKECQN